MLIQSCDDFLFVAKDVLKSWWELCPALSVEYYLRRADISMSHILLMHEVEGPCNLFGEMLQYGFWDGSYTLCEIIETSIGWVVLYYWNASFWAVPLSRMNLDEALLLWRIVEAAVMLPVGYPVNQHLPYLDVGNWNLFHRIHFKSRRVQHFLNRAWCWFENAQSNHRIETKILLLVARVLSSLLLHRITVIIWKCTTQIHHLLLARILQKLRDSIQLRQWIQSCKTMWANGLFALVGLVISWLILIYLWHSSINLNRLQ